MARDARTKEKGAGDPRPLSSKSRDTKRVGLRIVPFSFALLSLCAFSVQAHPPHHINVDETMTSNISLLGPDLPSELQPHISSVSGYLYLDGPAAVHISS